jgi:PAS domain S-box-containing protein
MAGKKHKALDMGNIMKTRECSTCEFRSCCGNEGQFRDVVENSLTGIAIVQDERIVYMNPEQQRIAGPKSLMGNSLPFENVHPEDLERVRDLYAQASRGEISNVDVDFRYFPPDENGDPGSMKWIKTRGCRIMYQGRESTLVNMIDMTRARELENLLSIEDKMASLGRVAAGLAHEIRNPLSGINVYLKMIRKISDSGDGLGKLPEIVEQMQEASARIEGVIRRIMDFSKPCEPKFVLTDLNEPLGDAMELTSTTLRTSGISLEKDLSTKGLSCRIDPHMIVQVILNLITNAAEAMKSSRSDRRINISSYPGKGTAIVTVSDSGPGVPAAVRDRIFDPFFTTKSDSTGIGLSICKRIIADHKGSLSVTESPWGGARFVIEIPLGDGAKA